LVAHARRNGRHEPTEQWRALAKGQPEAAKIPEVLRSIELLRRSAGRLRAGAEGSRELLNSGKAAPFGQPLDPRAHASVEKSAAAYKEIAAKIDEMAHMLERSQAPSLEQVQGIEKLLMAQHDAADQRARDLGALEKLRRG